MSGTKEQEAAELYSTCSDMREHAHMANREFHEGTVTFLFTDIEGSTRLLDQLGKNYARLLNEHHLILRDAFDKHRGRELGTQGDSFFASFPRASDALAAVVHVQRALAQHDWPEGASVRVRMGLHTGEPWLVDEGYIGMDIHRAARIAHVGNGGQILLSETTTSLIWDDLPTGVSLQDLGYHLLKDMRRPERIHQLDIEGLPSDFPPIKSLEALPSEAGETELDAVAMKREVGSCPYRGLVAFRQEDAPFFFGRETFAQRLEESVKARGLVAVIVGPSGSGKSSVVFAGLLPRLHDDPSWCIVQIRPGDEPILSLASALAPLIHQEVEGTDLLLESRKLATALSNGELSLHQLAKDILDRQPSAERFLLVIDQFEEIFTLAREDEERRRLMDELLDASQKGAVRRPPSFVLLLTLRADFMGQALAYRPFADALQDASLMLGPMNRAELKTAIEKPAELQGAAFEPGLVDRLLDDVGDEPGNLPLLEFALTLLWEQMDIGWMTHAIYDEIGRVDGALARYADEIFTGLNPQEQNEVRRAFLQLIQPGRGTEDTRRLASRDELVGLDWDLVRYLADKRLVVTGRNETGIETVELVHEALIRSWDRLRAWIDADRSFRSWQEGLRGNLSQWESTGRDQGALLRGAPLIQAEEWLVKRTEDLSPAEAAYIRASLERDRMIRSRRIRRRRYIFAGLTIGLILAVILSIFALSQRSSAIAESEARATQQAIAEEEAHARATQQFLAEAESDARATQQALAESESEARATQQSIAEGERARAEEAAVEIADQKAVIEAQARASLARNLASYALATIGSDPQLGLLLALEAAYQTYSEDGSILPEAKTALHQSIQNVSRLVYTIPAQGSGIPYINFTRDGSRLVARYFPSEVDPRYPVEGTSTLIWDAQSSQLLYTLPKGVAVASWPETPFVGIVDVADGETLLNLWDPLDGTARPLVTLTTPDITSVNDLSAVMLAPDAQSLLLAWANGRQLQLWDLETGTRTELPFLWGGGLDLLSQPYFGGSGFIKIGVPSYAAISQDGAHIYKITPRQTVLTQGGTDPYQYFSMWNAETGQIKSYITFEAADLGNINTALSFPPNEKFFAKIAEDRITIHSLETKKEISTIFSSEGVRFDALAFSIDSSRLATADTDGYINIWDVSDLAEDGSIKQIITLEDPGNLVHDMQFSPTGQWLAAAYAGGQIKLWNIEQDPGAQRLFGEDIQETDEGSKTSLAVSPLGNRIAYATQQGSAFVYDLDLEERGFQLGGAQPGPVEQIEYSPDGSTITTCRYDGPFQVWDAESGTELFRLDDFTEAGCAFNYHPDRQSVFLGFFKNGYGWHQEVDLPSFERGLLIEAEPLRTYDWQAPHQGETRTLAFDQQSHSLATISEEGEFFIWDTRLPIETLPGAAPLNPADSAALLLRENRGYQEVLLDPAQGNLVITALDGFVRVMDPEANQFRRSIDAHRGPITAAAFSIDGNLLATSGQDRAVRVWDFATGDVILDLPDQAVIMTDLAFSPDGRRLYAAGTDGAVRSYILDADELMALAQSKATRDLTEDECRKYLFLASCPDPRATGTQ